MNPESRNPQSAREDEILAHFQNWNLDKALRDYLGFHARRYEYLLEKIARILAVTAARPPRILDIGASFQTSLMRAHYPETVVDTLGFEDERFPRRPQDLHIDFDLNDSSDRDKWPCVTPYDLVVMAEVIEHVYTAARAVLAAVASFLAPVGALIVQTPNAISLGRRASMLKGRNPFGMIREDRRNPGHFCEFISTDLREVVVQAGLNPREVTLTNYFGGDGMRNRLYGILCATLPGELHDGITLIAYRR